MIFKQIESVGDRNYAYLIASENPFIQRLDNFSKFLWLKQNRVSYKHEHGIK